MPEPASADALTWRSHWPAALIAAVGALIALWARHRLFPGYSWNRDEPVYLWHVDVLRSGRFSAPDGGHPDLFRPWLSALGDDRMYTQYTLGWPLVLLAAAVLTGSAGNAMLLGAALAVIGTYSLAFELLRSRRVAVISATLMTASPILAVQGGVYLSYLFTLGLGLLFGALLLSGVRLERRGRVIAGGVLLGWIFLTRPYDAVLWGAAFGGYLAVVERHRWRAVVRPILLAGGAALPLVVAALAYNRHLTGGWLRFPITAADPMDTFGFGNKRLMPTFEVQHYGITTALKSTAKNAFVLPWFLVGGYLGLAVAGVGLWQGRRHRPTLALVLVGAVFPVGYFVFWGTYLSSQASRISGPIYFVPLYTPICVLAGSVLARWWPSRRGLAVGMATLLAVGTVPGALSRFDVNRDISIRQEPWRRSVADLVDPSLVFVADTGAYLLYSNPFSANAPDLDGTVLYAAADTPSMLDLIAEQPDRRPYLQEGTIAAPELGPREDPYDLAVILTPLEVRRGTSLELVVTIAAPPGATFASLQIDAGAGAIELTEPVRDGNVTQTVRLDGPAAPGTTRLVLADRGSITTTIGFGTSEARARAAPRARQAVQYRRTSAGTEVLLPATAEIYEAVKDEHEWRHAVGISEVTVDVRAVAEP